MKNAGFTLVEVLIFTLLISLIFTALSSMTAVSLRTAKYNEHKIIATYYGEELREWLRSETEGDWEAFPKSGTYCFNTSPIQIFGTSGNCGSSYSLGSGTNAIFKRYASINALSTTTINVSILVLWKEGGNNYQIPINTTFALYE